MDSFLNTNNNLFEFKVRAHGHSSTNPNATWPDYTNDFGINQLSSSGNTPTGLMSFDLNFRTLCKFLTLRTFDIQGPA